MDSDQSVNSKVHDLEELEVLRCSGKADHEQMILEHPVRDKTRMESELRKKQMLLQENQVWIEDISVELRDTLVQMRECEIENECYPMKINSINMAIAELEKQLNNLKETKEWTEQKLEVYNRHIEELSERKASLDTELNRRTEIARTIQEEIVELTDRIQQNLKRKKTTSQACLDPNEKLLTYLIAKKEKDLECPVCLVTASAPIFSCPENHLICSVCRPQMTECPECRVEYRDNKKPRRHRYAEKMLEELDIMKKEIV